MRGGRRDISEPVLGVQTWGLCKGETCPVLLPIAHAGPRVRSQGTQAQTAVCDAGDIGWQKGALRCQMLSGARGDAWTRAFDIWPHLPPWASAQRTHFRGHPRRTDTTGHSSPGTCVTKRPLRNCGQAFQPPRPRPQRWARGPQARSPCPEGWGRGCRCCGLRGARLPRLALPFRARGGLQVGKQPAPLWESESRNRGCLRAHGAEERVSAGPSLGQGARVLGTMSGDRAARPRLLPPLPTR